MPAELSIVRFRDGLEPQHKSVCMQVTRTLEKHAKKQLRGLKARSVLVIICLFSDTDWNCSIGSRQYQ